MELPKFLSKEGNALIYNRNDGSTLIYYIPENYFNNTTKVPIAMIEGQYVSSIGVFNWAIVDKNGKRGPLKPFTFPTMFICKPREIDTKSGKKMKLDNTEEANYVLLKFQYGDEVISQTKVPQLIDNVEIFFKMAITTAKIPTTIPYDKLWELFFESASLNGFSYNLNIQLFCMLIAAICRDKNDISRQFNQTDMSDMHNYTPIDIKTVPKYISPYSAISSENWDESIRAAVLMKDKEDTPISPMEKVVTM